LTIVGLIVFRLCHLLARRVVTLTRRVIERMMCPLHLRLGTLVLLADDACCGASWIHPELTHDTIEEWRQSRLWWPVAKLACLHCRCERVGQSSAAAALLAP